MNFRYKLIRFMSGRYGLDTLFYVLFSVAAVLSLINCFVRSYILQIIVYAIVIFAFFRVMSRNIEKRRRENAVFIRIASKLKERKELRDRRKADYNHIYKKCPHCRAVLRLPRRKGRHETVCPKCNTHFTVNVKH